ncbi:universal stress protein [Mucilaginibacter sp. PAMB04168]|uniref:universal stress protein n=1 Tax=Mucilaginibacter sp. PAMB04168 TaxID=3138567 RepID=UPI0031F62050
MKKIAVLTDFSERSANAAAYALAIACRLKADVLLFHTFLVPSSETMGAQIAWPMEDFEEIKAGAEATLQETAQQLSTALDRSKVGFCPKIECQAQEGNLNACMETSLAGRDVVLLVMANHHKGFSSLMLGNHTQQVLDNTDLPVLIIPEAASFQNVKKIAVATDLKDDDLQIIHSLANLARPFNAEILLTHVCEHTPENMRKVEDFLHKVTNKINYPNIYHREFDEHNTHKGLQDMAGNVQADLMVMVHRRKNFFEQLLGISYSQKLAAESKVPLLVFPYPTETLPVF